MTEKAEASERKEGAGRRFLSHQRVEYWSHVAHIVNAVAVSATLLYVGLELHHNTVMAERLNRDASFQQAVQIQLAIGIHRDVAELLVKGEADAAALDAPDQLRFERIMTALIRGFQQIWEREQIGSFPAGNFLREVAPGFTSHLNSPGGKAWWQRRKMAFPADYVRDVDRALADAQRAPTQQVRSPVDAERTGGAASNP